MKLYPVPGGTWEGTEADWKKAMKARGLNPKDFPGAREVPTGKKELMEFLTFNAVDVYRLPAGTTVSPEAAGPDVDALRALHNPGAVRPSTLTPPASDGATEADRQLGRLDNPGVDIEAVVEFACHAKGAALKRIAGAVATNFAALAAG